MFALPLAFLAPAGPRARLSVLTFHRVYAATDALFPAEPDAARFRRWVAQWQQWFNFLPLGEAAKRLAEGTLPARAACITFDDGYVDNLEVAAPILKSLGVPATFFIATDFMDGGMMFNDRVIEAFRQAASGDVNLAQLGLENYTVSDARSRERAVNAVLRKVKHLPYVEREAATHAIAKTAGATLDPHPMMTPAQVQALAGMGFEIGAHTKSHPILRQQADADARDEIVESRRRLQSLTGQAVSVFSYPNGRPNEDYDLRHCAMVREAGFIGAVSTMPGAAKRGCDMTQIPRFTPWHGDSWKSGVQFLRNFSAPDASLRTG